jgi:hypothetical protein
MNRAQRWLKAHAYAAHVAAFLIMLAAPVWMFWAAQHATAAQHAIAAQHAAPGWIYPPLALFVLANLLELFIP